MTTSGAEPIRRASWRALEPQVLTDERLLGQRASQLVRLRLLFAAMIVAGAAAGRWIAGIRSLPVGELAAAGLLVAVYGAVAWVLVRRWRDPTADGPPSAALRALTYGAIVADDLVLAFVAWSTGGARSPLLPFFLVHAILSGVMLGKIAALALHGFACVLVAALIAGEWTGAIPVAPVAAELTGAAGPVDGRHAVALVAGYAIVFAITAFVLTSFSSTVRRHERRIRETNAELSRLSEMRRDFLDVALHNLQSPVAAVRMHVGNVTDGLGGPVTDQQREWLARALARLDHLSEFMRSLSMLSTLETVNVADRSAPVDVAQVLEDVVRDHQDAAQARRIALGLGTPVPAATVSGIEVLVREAVVNYVTNALKYVQDGGHVAVRASVSGGRVRIEVGDDGPGIAPEDVPRLFQEFVRLREKGRPVPKVRGSGLGLTIVRRIAELHGGSAGVTSEPGRGSTFWIELPSAPS